MADWVIDLNLIKRKEIRELEADRQKAVKTGDDTPLIKWLARTIKTWPYTSDPGAVESYQELGFLEYMEAMRRFGEAFQRVADSIGKAGQSGVSDDEGSAAGTGETSGQ